MIDMKQRYVSPQQSIRPGTEYARSIARHRPRRQSAMAAPMFGHPWAAALALALAAAGLALLWPRAARVFRAERDGDVDFADFPPRPSGASAR
jgi:hypothetical protein